MSEEALGNPPDATARRTLDRLQQTLPVRPGPLLDLMAYLGEDPRAVVQIIERDPAMAGRVLGVVNAAGNRRLHEITSVHRAVLQLGAAAVRSLGLAMGLQQMAEQTGIAPERLGEFWNTSLYKAEAAGLAAQVIDPARRRSAYSAGLIADLGLPLLMALDPEFYERDLPFRAPAESWCEAELRHFGIDHAAVGARVLRQWDVPADTVEQVAMHHELAADTPSDADTAVRLAVFIAGLLPHDGGEMSARDLDRFVAAHGRLLSSAYASPDDFLGQVHLQARRRVGQDPRRDAAASDPRRFLDAVAANSIQLISQNHRLRVARAQQQEDLNNLRFEAFTDGLTKLLNRRGFFSLLRQRLEQYPGGVGGCCMLLDLNEFKPVNDRHGHDAGDLVLRGLAKLLRRSVGRADLIGRLGGDEFVIFLTDLTEQQACATAARVCDTALGKTVRVGPEATVPLSFSLGAIYHPAIGSGVSVDALLTAADELMYRCKRSNRPGMLFAPYAELENYGRLDKTAG